MSRYCQHGSIADLCGHDACNPPFPRSTTKPESKIESPITPEDQSKDRVCELVNQANAKGDAQETIQSAELFLLRGIAAASSDLIKGREWEEFRDSCGGIEALETAHQDALRAYERWVEEGIG
jgi:hypothetical protein